MNNLHTDFNEFFHTKRNKFAIKNNSQVSFPNFFFVLLESSGMCADPISFEIKAKLNFHRKFLCKDF